MLGIKVTLTNAFILLTILSFMLSCTAENKTANEETSSLKVLIVTGGHGFERDAFFAMFDSFKDLNYVEVAHPQANDWLAPEKASQYDVFVFYDMNQEITEEQKSMWLDLLNKGKGMLFLHHSLASYQDWDEFEKIRGGKYFLKQETNSEQDKVASTYRHDVDFMVSVVDVNHPITRGIQNFEIHDEVYGKFSVLPGVQPLLTTDHPESGKTIGWSHIYGSSRIVYLQLGHDHYAYENVNYRKVVEQAIHWVAKLN